jgi:hypothetical protein
MKNIKYPGFAIFILMMVAACNHSKPKPISNNITKTTVTVDGKKDSVINNTQKNYGNATVSEPCVKCLIAVIQNTDSYKKLTGALPPQKIIYAVNWITSTKPRAIGNRNRIINGMAVDVNQKTGTETQRMITYLYNNADSRLYLINSKNKFDGGITVGDTSLTKIRNSCFWGVASAK